MARFRSVPTLESSQSEQWLLCTYFFVNSSCFPARLTPARQPRVCWCRQLCLMLVTELSVQRCSHLRSWQPPVVSEQQTHFSITPLSPTPRSPLSSHFIWHSPLFTHLIYCSFSSLSRLPYSHLCSWFCCQPSTRTERADAFSHSIFHLLPFSDWLPSSLCTSHLSATPIFHCLLLKNVFSMEASGEYSRKGARLL